MKTIKELEEVIKNPCKDYDLPKGNPWTDVIKEGCKKEAKLKIGVFKDVLKVIDVRVKKHEDFLEEFPEKDNLYLISKGVLLELEQIKDAISGDEVNEVGGSN